MIPTLTTELLTSVNDSKINGLSNSGGMASGLSEEGFGTEFSTLIQSLLLPGGNEQPLKFADLGELNAQQLTDLATQLGIELPPAFLTDAATINPPQLESLIEEISKALEHLNVAGVVNPNANALLKSTLANTESADEDLLTKNNNATDLIIKTATNEQMQQGNSRKAADITLALADADLDTAEYMKKMSVEDADLNAQLLSQSTRPENSTTKLAESLVNIDKPGNVIHALNSQITQPSTNQESSSLMMRRIEVPVQQAAWGDAVGNRLMMMVNDKIQSAKIHLNPAELGPIEVRVNVSQDQASVHFVSNNSLVRDAIDEAFPRLKEMFAQNGLTLSDANVSQQSSQQGQSNLTDQNDTSILANNESVENSETETASITKLSSGLVDQYV